MAEIANFPSRKKTKGFLSSIAASDATDAEPGRELSAEPSAVENPSTPIARAPDEQVAPAPTEQERGASKTLSHNTTINLTRDQRAWLRWREVVTKQSMGDLIRAAIEDQMRRDPMSPEVAAIFGS